MRRKKLDNAGFTLAEMLITIAIIAILSAVAAVAAVTMIRNVRQANSDKVAESLYSAVSAHLQEVYAFDYGKVTTLQVVGETNKAAGVSETDVAAICYISKNIGESLTDSDKRSVVLGKNGSAVGADYYGDSIIVEYNPSSLQVYSIFYSSQNNPDEYYPGGAGGYSLDELRAEASNRKAAFNGYLGYYQANTQDLPELNENEYGVTVGLTSQYTDDPKRHLRNLDELTAPISVHIPAEEYSNREKLKFEIKVTGVSSGASALITYDEKDASNGGVIRNNTLTMIKDSPKYTDAKMVSFEIVLDNLKDGTFNDLFCKDPVTPKKTTIRFYGKTTGVDETTVIIPKEVPITLTAKDGKYFTPGEDVEVMVSAVKVDDVEMNIAGDSENLADDNSLFAYGSQIKTGSDEHYAAYLAYGRHLQNLSNDISGINSGEPLGTLSTRKTRAFQVAKIDFTPEADNYDDEKNWRWPNLYSDTGKTVPYDSLRPFIPIVNSQLDKLEGDYKLEYSTSASALVASTNRSAGYVGPTTHSINGLIIRSTATKTITDAGIFASYTGSEIKNITLTNPRISGVGVTGGLIAKAALKNGQALNIENCALYMTDEYTALYDVTDAPYGIVEKTGGSNDPDKMDDDATGIWMSGKQYAGGLIGQFLHDTTDTATTGTSPRLTILNSHASTVIDTTLGYTSNTANASASGGLIGFVGNEGGSAGKPATVSIQKSYADNYIYGENYTGGLIGYIKSGNTVSMENVYTAGFQDGMTQAGLANGTVNSIRTSYSFMQMNIGHGASVYTTATGITSADKVYYFPQNSANSGNAGNIEDLDNTTNAESLVTQGSTSSVSALLLAQLGSAFENDPGSTNPYNMREGMALSTYPRPKLKSIIHYGDWEADFMPGALCYYEKYVKAGSKVRFYGGNYNALYDTLEEGEAVQGDGYGLVFRKDDTAAPIPDSATVKYYFADGEKTEEIDLKNTTPIASDYNTKNYVIYPLSKTNVNHVMTSDSPFYTKVEVTYKNGDTALSTDVFYFNPHFARAVGYIGPKSSATDTQPIPGLKTNGVIYVRSARHLYNMSLYYKNYLTSTKDRTYRQTYDISYKDYDWHTYFNDGVPDGSYIYRQDPIAMNYNERFQAKYNGGSYKIRDISFVLEKGKNSDPKYFYTGLFGYNVGDLRNIVLFADYNESDTSAAVTGKTTVSTTVGSTVSSKDHFYVQKSSPMHFYAGTDEDIGKNKELYLGVLVGRNAGTVSNCATAGYNLADANGTVVGNTNGYIYAGGLVGDNSGTISNAAADTPFIRLTTNYTTAFVGGFAGRNTGRILDSYSLGHIEVMNPRGGTITLAGFASRNTGEIVSSYAAENIWASGNSTIYPFSPNGGSVRGCTYLNEGTFSYVGHLYSYNYQVNNGTGTARTREQLIGDASVKVKNTEDYPAFKDNDDKTYPYKAVITDRNGEYTHYGDWQRDPGLGECGIFYWEKEEGGGNPGYHFSFVGVDNSNNSIAGTTLCNAHDDGGIVVDYGYGYYEKTGHPVTSEAVRGLNLPASSMDTVAAELKKEATKYTFYPYRTLPNGAADKSGYLYLSYTGDEVKNADNSTDIRNGEWKLTRNSSSTTFYVAPFFANAMSVNGASGELVITSQDGINTTDYLKKPGTQQNPYEIRTVEQLQYINWNAANQNVSTMVTDNETELNNGTYKAFPYLAYASQITKGKQKKTTAGHNETLKFLQTHDASGLKSDNTSVISNYTPIAASQNASSASSYTAILYTWFGSDYDGQSYKITNINISSPALSVGVFGVTVSAGLKNIILYSDNGSVIERRNGSDLTPGGYSVGGLVGIAYKYADAAAGTGTIENCAVAGYKIKDESTNQLTQGESNVGGLIGATTVNVKNCSAVTDIEINCTHNNGHSTWGDYVRVGGLIGALPGEALNCYSGGSIKVGEDTLKESRDQWQNLIAEDEEEGKTCWREYSMNVYIGGIAGSAFSMNYQNFTDSTGADDKSPTMKNCYTYVEFPELRGSIRSIAMIASLADRYGNDSLINNYRVNIINCHYLNTFDKSKVERAAKYIIRSDGSHIAGMSAYDALNSNDNYYTIDAPSVQADETFFENMLRGGGAYATRITGYRNARIYAGCTYDEDDHPTELSYDQLAGKSGGIQVWNRSTNAFQTYGDGGFIQDALNQGGDADGTFDWVTIDQNGANIDGKYTFPGNNKALDGLNYSFPTIVTQRDIVFNRDVNVHYGVWPLSGMYWSEARSEMDIFGDQSTDGWAYKELQVIDTGDVDLAEKDTTGKYKLFEMEVGDIVDIADVQPTTINGKNGYNVKIRALKTGTETITVGGTAKLVLEVKANFSVSTNPTEIIVPSVNSGDTNAATKSLGLSAQAVSTSGSETKDLSQKAIWTVTIRDGSIGYLEGNSNLYEYTYPANENTAHITGRDPGKTQIVAKAVLTYNNVPYESSVYLPMQTYGVIGLSNYGLSSASDANGFRNECSRASEGTPVGQDKDDRGTNAPKMDEDGWTDLYIYESYADETLGNATIESITLAAGLDSTTFSVTDDNDPAHEVYTWNDHYKIDIGSVAEKMSTDGKYRYRGLKLRPVDGQPGGEVTVQITLSDGETDAIYQLSGTLTQATHVVTADANKPAASAYEVDLRWKSKHANSSGEVDLTGDNIIPTLVGYNFIGWDSNSDGTADYCTVESGTGDRINRSMSGVSSDITLKAIWEAIHYKIKFAPGQNGQENTPLPDISTTYDANPAPTLPTKDDVDSAYSTTVAGTSFVGWNTQPEGNGDSFEPGATVSRLVEVEGGEITLYAQWRGDYELRFVDYKDGSDPALVQTGKRYVEPNPPATSYTFVGDDILGGTLETRNGVNGYYWVSSSGSVYRLAGWDTNRRKSPSEVTFRITYNGTDAPVLPTISNINGDGTYYAIWEELGYSIVFQDHLATDPTTTVSDLSGSIKSINGRVTPPTHAGYTFVGWYTDRIANGGSKFAGTDGLLQDGKSLSELATENNSITVHARYKEDVYIKLDNNSLKNNGEYLITITETGNSAEDYKGLFAYLLANNTTDYYNGNNPGYKDLAGKDHAFKQSSDKFYSDESGAVANKRASEQYMDGYSMPSNVYCVVKDRNNPISQDIPANAIWTFEGTGSVGKFKVKDTSDYLYIDNASPAHLHVGATQQQWEYKDHSGKFYKLQNSTNGEGAQAYNLHKDYWNYNVNTNSGNNVQEKNNSVILYEKTTVYLDEVP